MSNDGPLGRYRDRVSRDADDISGFFTTRAGQITGVTLIGAMVAALLYSLVAGWFA